MLNKQHQPSFIFPLYINQLYNIPDGLVYSIRRQYYYDCFHKGRAIYFLKTKKQAQHLCNYLNKIEESFTLANPNSIPEFYIIDETKWDYSKGWIDKEGNIIEFSGPIDESEYIKGIREWSQQQIPIVNDYLKSHLSIPLNCLTEPNCCFSGLYLFLIHLGLYGCNLEDLYIALLLEEALNDNLSFKSILDKLNANEDYYLGGFEVLDNNGLIKQGMGYTLSPYLYNLTSIYTLALI